MALALPFSHVDVKADDTAPLVADLAALIARLARTMGSVDVSAANQAKLAAIAGGTLTINHSPITGNSAGLGGGGIFNVNATVTLSHVTIGGNNCEPTGTIAGCTG